jgi:Na+/H+-translocating membrane pyrophosphatase
MDLTWLALSVGVLAMLVVTILAWSILREPVGPRQKEKVVGFIEEGAKAQKNSLLTFLKNFSRKFD